MNIEIAAAAESTYEPTGAGLVAACPPKTSTWNRNAARYQRLSELRRPKADPSVVASSPARPPENCTSVR